MSLTISPLMLTNATFSSAFLHQWCGGGVRAGVGPADAIPLLKNVQYLLPGNRRGGRSSRVVAKYHF